jgi:hypothetical protein
MFHSGSRSARGKHGKRANVSGNARGIHLTRKR